MSVNGWSETERALFAALGDSLIPSAPGAVSASQARISGPLLDEIERHVPERMAMLRRVVERAQTDSPDSALARLKSEEPALYDLFCETVAAAYFMAPQVRETIGFVGRAPKPARIDADDLVDLLSPILDAGFAPRRVD